MAEVFGWPIDSVEGLAVRAGYLAQVAAQGVAVRVEPFR